MTDRIQIIETENDRRSPLDEYLGHLENGSFITPARGPWRQHDEGLHLSRIESLNPEEVSFVMDAAQVGRKLLRDGEQFWSGYTAERLDLYLTNCLEGQIKARKVLEGLITQYGVQSRLF